MHLHAAWALFINLTSEAETSKHVWDITTIPVSYQYLPSDAIPYSANKGAFRFLTAVLMWYDTLSCIYIGSRPPLEQYHGQLLAGNEPLIELDQVMGCKSKVMIFIA